MDIIYKRENSLFENGCKTEICKAEKITIRKINDSGLRIIFRKEGCMTLIISVSLDSVICSLQNNLPAAIFLNLIGTTDYNADTRVSPVASFVLNARTKREYIRSIVCSLTFLGAYKLREDRTTPKVGITGTPQELLKVYEIILSLVSLENNNEEVILGDE